MNLCFHIINNRGYVLETSCRLLPHEEHLPIKLGERGMNSGLFGAHLQQFTLNLFDYGGDVHWGMWGCGDGTLRHSHAFNCINSF